jgi:hypothetical protein
MLPVSMLVLSHRMFVAILDVGCVSHFRAHEVFFANHLCIVDVGPLRSIVLLAILQVLPAQAG